MVSASVNLNSKTSLHRTEGKRGLGERLGLVGEGLEIRGSDGGEEGILGQWDSGREERKRVEALAFVLHFSLIRAVFVYSPGKGCSPDSIACPRISG